MSKPIIMIGGRSDTGKTASLKDLKDPSEVLYLNFDPKDMPFRNDFAEVKVTDPYTLHTITDKLLETGLDKYKVLVIDSITACMSLYATKYIGKNCQNKMAAWGDYGSFYDEWAKQKLPLLKQAVIVLAHVTDFEDADTLRSYSQAAVQGRLKNIGLEADFGVVVNTVLMPVETLKEYDNPLLTITEEDEIEGFKHVYQTRKTLETAGGKIRSPIGTKGLPPMWDRSETYINPDAQIILDKYKQFYK